MPVCGTQTNIQMGGHTVDFDECVLPKYFAVNCVYICNDGRPQKSVKANSRTLADVCHHFHENVLQLFASMLIFYFEI